MRITFIRDLSIKAQLALLCLIILVPLLVFQGLEVRSRYRALYAQEVQANLEIARAVRGLFLGYVNTVLSAQTGIIVAIAEKGHTPEEISHILTEYERQTKLAVNLGWLSPECRVIASSNPAAIGMDLSDRAHLLQVAQGADWSISDLLVGRVAQVPLFHICKAVRDDSGNLKGILVASIDEERMAGELSFERGQSAGIAIIDRNGMLVFRHPRIKTSWEDRNWLKFYPFIQEVLAGKEYVGTYTANYDGKARIIANLPMPFGWIAGAGRSEDEVVGGVLSQIQTGLSIFGAILIAAVVAVLAVSGQIARSVSALKERSDAIGRGEFIAKERIPSTREFKDLSITLDSMSEKVRAREEALRQNEGKLAAIIEQLPVGVGVLKEDGKFILSNTLLRRRMPQTIPSKDPERRPRWKAFYPDGSPIPPAEWPGARALRGEAVMPGIEFQHIDGNGTINWLVVSAVPFRTSINVDGGAIVVLHDITERKRAEEVLRKYELLAGHSRDIILFMNCGAGQILEANAAAIKVYGYSREQLLGLTIRDLHAVEMRGLTAEQIEVAYEQGMQFETVHRRKDGSTFPVEVSSQGAQIGESKKLISVIRDITERKRTEEAIGRSERRFRALTEKAGEVITVLDATGKITFSIAGGNSTLGYTVEELIGGNAFELAHPDDLPGLLSLFQAGLSQPGRIEQAEFRIRAKDGSWRWQLAVGTNLLEDPAVGGIVINSRDITERKKAEKALQTTLQRFYTLLSGLHSSVLLVTDEGRIEYANQAFCDYFELQDSPAELRGLPSLEAVEKIKNAYLNPDEAATRIREIVDRGEHVIGEEVAMRGARTCLRDFIPLNVDGKSYGRLWHHWDITDRKKVEEERETAVEFLHLLNQSACTEALIRSATSFLQEKSGCEAVGLRLRRGYDYPYFVTQGFPKEFVLLENSLCSRDREGQPILDRVGNPVLDCMCGNVIRGRFDPSKPFFTARGSFWANSTTQLLSTTSDADRQTRTRNRCNGEGYESVALIALRSGEDRIGLLQFNDKRRDRFTPQIIALWERLADYLAVAIAKIQSEEALRDSQAELRKANTELEGRVSERTSDLAHTVDELRNANEQLDEKASKLRALAGDLTLTEQRERKRLSQILHDGLQQHLLSAKMRLGGVAEQIDSADLRQAVDEIEEILGESVKMSRSLSSELSPPILYEGGLADGLEWLARWMRDKHHFGIDFSIETRPELPEDVKLLVFESVRELLFNAVKHSKTSRARVSLEQVSGAGLRIAVSDEGAGFDPCRLKPVGAEGGFGLFSIRERIGLIGGRLEIDSAPGKGSRFALIVPHGQAPPVPMPVDRSCTPAVEPQKDPVKDQGTTIRVLLADDHALFRNGLGRLLKNEPGLEVVGQATDGREAVDLAAALKPDVILMDISMPRLTGIEATRIIHHEYPGIRIIGLSMYEDHERAQAMQAAGACDYKTKGCAASELVSAIRDCMVRR